MDEAGCAISPVYTYAGTCAPSTQCSAAASGESQRCLRDAGGATGPLRERPRPRPRPRTPRPFLNGAGSHHTAAAAVQLRAQLSGMGVLERVRLRGRAPRAGKRRWAGAPRLALRASRSATVPLANERPGAGRLRSVRRPCARPTPRRSSRSSGRYLPCIPAMPPRGPRQAPTRPRAAPGIARLRVASCLLASSWRLGRHCATSSALLAATARPLEPFPSRSSL